MTQEQIDAIAERRTPKFDDPDDQLVYEFAHGYYQNHRISDDIYERVRQRWGDKGIVDLAGLIGYYWFVSVTLNVFEVPTPPGAKLLSETRGALSDFSHRHAANGRPSIWQRPAKLRDGNHGLFE